MEEQFNNDFSSEDKIILPQVNTSGWKCYLFGSYPSTYSIIYCPEEGKVPNWFIRWMMKICLGCVWIKEA